MSIASIRSALATALAALGFSRCGAELVLRQSELEHVVSVSARRGLAGYFEVMHRVFKAGSVSPRNPLIEDRILGFVKPYPGLWSADQFDPSLVQRQVAAIADAFSSLADIAHFYSDRPLAWGMSAFPDMASTAVPKSLSRAQMAARLQHHSRALFDDHFRAAPGLGVDIWAHHEEVGSYRYCVYLNPTDSATFATIVYFSFASVDIAKGRRNNEVLRLLYGAPKRVLSVCGQPVLVPLTVDQVNDLQVREILMRRLAENPANALVRRDD